ncbi:hypothetical protein VC83_08128 [Pseudogymnoascus destructans]|uniref:Tat pathway signal sequence n=2 Tax=Pseudogymnoascus destructans TaxID=655981 RepID=L8FYW6_PSED2|nr:uncharacterized protein VC83_08128 [Pseudogymnoascus destructans]ELR06047.1 hypothetical protein GMDG_07758 [Pseudogymnoascus destructans 20631-21]OAF55313.1 hypothetical protein VC83_08128 [Pseudogymnoascus destructans]
MSKFIASDSHVSSEYSSKHADSSTSLMVGDEGLPFDADSRGQFKGSRRSTRRCFTPWQNWPLIITLLFLIAGLSIWTHVIILVGRFRCDSTPATDHFGPDLPYSSRVTFQPHKFYGGLPSNATDEIWQRLSPPGDGIIEVPTEYTTSLAASLPAPNNPATAKVYGVSMFHQLHCLNFLRTAYYPEGITTMSPEETLLHRDHCLDYIRQAIMCAGDVTLEPLTKAGINGMGAVHQCRDFDRIFSWAYEHGLYKARGSDARTRQ